MSSLARVLNDFLDPDLILSTLRAHDAVKRVRTVEPVILVWTLILGSCCATKRSIASAHRAFERHTGHTLARSSFYDRFSLGLEAAMRALLDHALSRTMGQAHAGAFAQVLALDATIVSLWGGLRDKLPGCAKGSAGAKLQVVYNLLGAKPTKVKLFAEKKADQACWKTLGPWVKGALLIVDMGYYSWHFFHLVDQNGGFFLTRLKSGCALEIVSDISPGAGRRSKKVVGMKLKDALKRTRRQTVCYLVRVEVELRPYRGKSRTKSYVWRAVGRRLEDGSYRMYLTNTTQDQIKGSEVGEYYRLRWQVELLFKTLRQEGGLGDVATGKRHVVKTWMWAAMLRAALVGAFSNVLQGFERSVGVNPMQVGKVVREWGERMLGDLCESLGLWLSDDPLEIMSRQVFLTLDSRPRALHLLHSA